MTSRHKLNKKVNFIIFFFLQASKERERVAHAMQSNDTAVLDRRQQQMKRYEAYAEAAIKASWRLFHCEKEIAKGVRAEHERTSYDALRVRRFELKQDLAPKQAAHDAAMADMLRHHRLCDAMLSRKRAAAADESVIWQKEAIAASASLRGAAARAETTHAVWAAAAAALKGIDDDKAEVDAELRRMDAAMAKASTDAFAAAAGVMARLGKRKLEVAALRD
jgi:hypothetical protein